jgi:signal transduction histidine kinase
MAAVVTMERARAARGFRLSLRTKLLLGMVIPLVIAVVQGFFVYQSLHRVDDTRRQMSDAGGIIVSAQGVEKLVLDAQTAERGYAISGEQGVLDTYTTAVQSIPASSADLEQLMRDAPRALAEVNQATGLFDQWTRSTASVVIAARARGPLDAQTALLVTTNGEQTITQIRTLLDGLVSDQRAIRAQALLDNQSASRTALLVSLLGPAIAIAASVVILGGLGEIVARRVNHIAAVARAFGHGEPWRRTAVTSNDEVGDLATSFNEMAERIQAAGEEREMLFSMERRKNEAEAASRELETFSYSVAHDLRAPLRTIDGMAQIVTEDAGAKLNDDERGYIDKIRANTQKMGAMIDALLEMARSARGEIKWETVDLSSITEGFARDLKAEDPNRKIRFDIQEGVVAAGDRRLLSLVIQNLVSNAWKFTAGHDAEVRFSARTEGVQVICCVADNGAGFDMKYYDRVFTPFQRLHDPGEFPGVGVGLATAQRIVERHGGRIWAEGEVGKGARFFVVLPLVAPEPDGNEPAAAPAPVAAGVA